MRSSLLATGAVGCAVFTAAYASAASLGMTSDTLGADSSVVASCDNAIGVDYTTVYVDAATDGYMVDKVVLNSLLDACDGLSFSVTLTGTGGAVLETITGTLTVGAAVSETVEFANTTLAKDVLGVHAVISG